MRQCIAACWILTGRTLSSSRHAREVGSKVGRFGTPRMMIAPTRNAKSPGIPGLMREVTKPPRYKQYRKKRKESTRSAAISGKCFTSREIRPVQPLLEHWSHCPHLPVLHPLPDRSLCPAICCRCIFSLYPVVRPVLKRLQSAFSFPPSPHSERTDHREAREPP